MSKFVNLCLKSFSSRPRHLAAELRLKLFFWPPLKKFSHIRQYFCEFSRPLSAVVLLTTPACSVADLASRLVSRLRDHASLAISVHATYHSQNKGNVLSFDRALAKYFLLISFTRNSWKKNPFCSALAKPEAPWITLGNGYKFFGCKVFKMTLFSEK